MARILPPEASTALPDRLPVLSRAVLDRDRQHYEAALIRVRVRGWATTLAPVTARYTTSAWTERRGLGSCYLHLPATTGERAIIAAQQALGQAKAPRRIVPGKATPILVFSPAKGVAATYRAALAAQLGYTTVRVRGASVATDESLPGPDERFDGHSTWTCKTRARAAGLPSDRRGSRPPGLLLGTSVRSTGALSIDAAPNDCSAVAVIVESGAASARDAYLLIAGALFGLGVALTLDLLRNRAQERQGA